MIDEAPWPPSLARFCHRFRLRRQCSLCLHRGLGLSKVHLRSLLVLRHNLCRRRRPLHWSLSLSPALSPPPSSTMVIRIYVCGKIREQYQGWVYNDGRTLFIHNCGKCERKLKN
ncbi:hypothetical protein RND81_12G105100 [Saponaria officinalis]|uniref:Uncharacterized protein n=1 Tax=Saponaria officinalis TaxID=3572 RepID=A0AAW1H8W4_SAPOF